MDDSRSEASKGRQAKRRKRATERWRTSSFRSKSFGWRSPISVPVADGGDFTTAVLLRGVGGHWVETDVVDALGRKLRAKWGLLSDGATAVIEVASAAGLASLKPDERNPMLSTSYGVGQLISAALDAGSRRILLGLGGSATVDGGVGLLEALGARFVDAHGGSIA